MVDIIKETYEWNDLLNVKEWKHDFSVEKNNIMKKVLVLEQLNKIDQWLYQMSYLYNIIF